MIRLQQAFDVVNPGRLPNYKPDLKDLLNPPPALKHSISVEVSKIVQANDLSGGIVYFIVEPRNIFEVIAEYRSFNSDSVLGSQIILGAKNFASHVFKEGATVYVDDSSKDEHFDREFMKRAGVSGAVLGIPLQLFNRVYGVAVFWDNKTSISKEVADRTHCQLRFIASNTASEEEHRRKQNITQKYSSLLAEIITPASKGRCFGLFSKALCLAGLKRHRVFSYDHQSSSFKLEYANNVSSISLKVGDKLSDFKWNKYLMYLIERNGFNLSTGNKQRPLSRNIYGYQFTEALFGEDPYAERVGRAPGDPWLVAPMVSNHTFYGYVSADNGGETLSFDSEAINHLMMGATLLACLFSNRNTNWKWLESDIEHYSASVMVNEPLREESPRQYSKNISKLLLKAQFPSFNIESISTTDRSSKIEYFANQSQILESNDGNHKELLERIFNISSDRVRLERIRIGEVFTISIDPHRSKEICRVLNEQSNLGGPALYNNEGELQLRTSVGLEPTIEWLNEQLPKLGPGLSG